MLISQEIWQNLLQWSNFLTEILNKKGAIKAPFLFVVVGIHSI